MYEIKKHSKLLIILPQLKNNLEKVKWTTLSEYEVDYSFDVHEPQSPLGKHIAAEFRKKRAINLITRGSREYGFAECEQPLATGILTEQLDHLSVNNLDRERFVSF